MWSDSLNSLSLNISHFRRSSGSYYYTCTEVLIGSTRCACQILMDPEISRQILEKSPITKFHENRSTGKAVLWLQACTESPKDVRTKYFKYSGAE